jgi:N-acetylglucosaminyldiphosphoundecaprenol N-acetyl-beta-D-mannosaminyltransferase
VKDFSVLGMKVNGINSEEVKKKIKFWIQNNESRYVCFANVHMTMESYDSEIIREAVNQADIVCPDGMPLTWRLRGYGEKNQEKISGPDFMLEACQYAEENNYKVGFYGSSNETLNLLTNNLLEIYPDLDVALAISPPYRKLDKKEEEEYINKINESQIDILFVGLGCPKQELWMFNNKGKLNTIMLGVGAAFDFHAGKIKRAPIWMSNNGLEWLYRLFREPRRLWKRYFRNNPRFIIYSFKEMYLHKK